MISLQDGSHQDGSHLGGLHLEKQRVGSCRILAPISKADPSQNAVLFCGTPVITLHYCHYSITLKSFYKVAALEVDGAVFSYGDKKVLSRKRKCFCEEKNAQILSGLSMTVAAGSVYALLGPSGCGKTTLLSCVLGRSI